jgi:hypothetical protein
VVYKTVFVTPTVPACRHTTRSFAHVCSLTGADGTVVGETGLHGVQAEQSKLPNASAMNTEASIVMSAGQRPVVALKVQIMGSLPALSLAALAFDTSLSSACAPCSSASSAVSLEVCGEELIICGTGGDLTRRLDERSLDGMLTCVWV